MDGGSEESKSSIYCANNPHTVFVVAEQCFPSLPDCFKPTETLGGLFVCVVSLQWWECVQSSHFFLCVPIFLVFLYLCEMGALGLGGFCSEPGLTAGKLFFSPVELTRNNQALVFCFLSWKALYFYLFYLRLEHIWTSKRQFQFYYMTTGKKTILRADRVDFVATCPMHCHLTIWSLAITLLGFSSPVSLEFLIEESDFPPN